MSSSTCCGGGCCSGDSAILDLAIPGRIEGELRHVWFNIETASATNIKRLKYFWWFVMLSSYLSVLFTAALQFDCFAFCNLAESQSCSLVGVQTPATCVDFTSTVFESSAHLQDAAGDVFRRNRRVIYWDPGVLVDNDTTDAFEGAEFQFRTNATGSVQMLLGVVANVTWGGEFLTMVVHDDVEIPAAAQTVAVVLQKALPARAAGAKTPSLTWMTTSPKYVTAEIVIRYVCLAWSTALLIIFIVGHATRDQVTVHLQDFAVRSFVKDYVGSIIFQVCVIIFCDPFIYARYAYPKSAFYKYWSDHFVFIVVATFGIAAMSFVSITLADIASHWPWLTRIRAIAISLVFAAWYITLDSIAYVNGLSLGGLLFGFKTGGFHLSADMRTIGWVFFGLGCLWVAVVLVTFIRNKDRVFWNKGKPSYHGKVRLRVLAVRFTGTLVVSYAIFYFGAAIPIQVAYSDFSPILGRSTIADVFCVAMLSNIVTWLFSVKSHRSHVAPESPFIRWMKNYYAGSTLGDLQAIEGDGDGDDDEMSSSASDDDEQENSQGSEDQKKTKKTNEKKKSPNNTEETTAATEPFHQNNDETSNSKDDDASSSPSKQPEKKKKSISLWNMCMGGGEETDDRNKNKNKNKKGKEGSDPASKKSNDAVDDGDAAAAAVEKVKGEGDSGGDGDGGATATTAVVVEEDNSPDKERPQSQPQQEQKTGGQLGEEAAQEELPDDGIVVLPVYPMKRKVGLGGASSVSLLASSSKGGHHHHRDAPSSFVASVGTARLGPNGERWTKQNFYFLKHNSASGFYFATEAEKIAFDDAHAMVPNARSFFCWETAVRALNLSNDVYFQAPEELHELIDDGEMPCWQETVRNCLIKMLEPDDAAREDEAQFEQEQKELEKKLEEERKQQDEDEKQHEQQQQQQQQKASTKGESNTHNNENESSSKETSTSPVQQPQNPPSSSQQQQQQQQQPPSKKEEPIKKQKPLLNIAQYECSLLRVMTINDVQMVMGLFAPPDAVGPTMYSRSGVWAPDTAPRTQGKSVDETMYGKKQQQQSSSSSPASVDPSQSQQPNAAQPAPPPTTHRINNAERPTTVGHRRRASGSETDYKFLDDATRRFGKEQVTTGGTTAGVDSQQQTKHMDGKDGKKKQDQDDDDHESDTNEEEEDDGLSLDSGDEDEEMIATTKSQDDDEDQETKRRRREENNSRLKFDTPLRDDQEGDDEDSVMAMEPLPPPVIRVVVASDAPSSSSRRQGKSTNDHTKSDIKTASDDKNKSTTKTANRSPSPTPPATPAGGGGGGGPAAAGGGGTAETASSSQQQQQQQCHQQQQKFRRIAHVVVAFRGSVNARNHAVNADFGRAIYREMAAATGSKAMIHTGFAEAWRALQPHVFKSLDHYLTLLQHRKFPVVFTGHSMGASMAVLAAYAFRKEFPSHPCSVYTFGMPRIGNTVFRDLYNKRVPETYRMVCENDFVSNLQHCNRVHVGREVAIDRDGNFIVEPNGLEHFYNPLSGVGYALGNHTLERYARYLEKIFSTTVILPFKTYLKARMMMSLLSSSDIKDDAPTSSTNAGGGENQGPACDDHDDKRRRRRSGTPTTPAMSGIIPSHHNINNRHGTPVQKHHRRQSFDEAKLSQSLSSSVYASRVFASSAASTSDFAGGSHLLHGGGGGGTFGGGVGGSINALERSHSMSSALAGNVNATKRSVSPQLAAIASPGAFAGHTPGFSVVAKAGGAGRRGGPNSSKPNSPQIRPLLPASTSSLSSSSSNRQHQQNQHSSPDDEIARLPQPPPPSAEPASSSFDHDDDDDDCVDPFANKFQQQYCSGDDGSPPAPPKKTNTLLPLRVRGITNRSPLEVPDSINSSSDSAVAEKAPSPQQQQPPEVPSPFTEAPSSSSPVHHHPDHQEDKSPSKSVDDDEEDRSRSSTSEVNNNNNNNNNNSEEPSPPTVTATAAASPAEMSPVAPARNSNVNNRDDNNDDGTSSSLRALSGAPDNDGDDTDDDDGADRDDDSPPPPDPNLESTRGGANTQRSEINADSSVVLAEKVGGGETEQQVEKKDDSTCDDSAAGGGGDGDGKQEEEDQSPSTGGESKRRRRNRRR